jgi:hypothetical protein
MKTRNGLFSLILSFSMIFAAGGAKIREQLGLRHWQLLSRSLVPDRASNAALSTVIPRCTARLPFRPDGGMLEHRHNGRVA